MDGHENGGIGFTTVSYEGKTNESGRRQSFLVNRFRGSRDGTASCPGCKVWDDVEHPVCLAEQMLAQT